MQRALTALISPKKSIAHQTIFPSRTCCSIMLCTAALSLRGGLTEAKIPHTLQVSRTTNCRAMQAQLPQAHGHCEGQDLHSQRPEGPQKAEVTHIARLGRAQSRSGSQRTPHVYALSLTHSHVSGHWIHEDSRSCNCDSRLKLPARQPSFSRTRHLMAFCALGA